jgi:hypothetical protein
MAILTEGKHPGEFLASEGNGTLSRDVVTLISGQNLVAGTVLGKITASGKYTIVNPGAVEGAGPSQGCKNCDGSETVPLSCTGAPALKPVGTPLEATASTGNAVTSTRDDDNPRKGGR